jgi:sentrin-specific protease 8
MRGKILMYGDVQLYQDDVQSCLPGNWVKDSIIEYQYERWERDLFNNYPKIAFVRPALVYLLQSTKSDVGLDLTSKSLIFFPVNDGILDQSTGSHWSLLIYKKSSNTFYYYDSMNNYNLKVAIAIKTAIEGIFPAGSKLVQIATPEQSNGYDCGIYVLAITRILAQRFSLNAEIAVDICLENLDSHHMSEIRSDICKDIEMIAMGDA